MQAIFFEKYKKMQKKTALQRKQEVPLSMYLANLL